MHTKKAVMIKICPLINLIIYLSVQIEKRDHRKENKEILHCSWTWQRFWPPQPVNGEAVDAPVEVKEQLRLFPDRWKPRSTSLSMVHLQPTQMSLLAGHCRTVLAWAVVHCGGFQLTRVQHRGYFPLAQMKR